MRALVVGGAGFIGSNVVDRLIAHGWECAVVDDLSKGRLSNLDASRRVGGVKFQRFDIRSDGLVEVVALAKPDVVFHFAAQASVSRSVADPVTDCAINVLGLVNLLSACRSADVPRFVFSQSGGTIYGEQTSLPISETAKKKIPTSPYGISKLTSENYLHWFSKNGGPSYVSLALANVYGPRQDPHGEAGVVSIFANAMLCGEQPVIFGDGLHTRDYIFVDDVAHAFVIAATRGDGDLLNISTGIETTNIDLHKLIADQTGYKAKPKYAEARAGDVRRSALDPKRADRILDFTPWTQLPDGIAQTVAWLRAELKASGTLD